MVKVSISVRYPKISMVTPYRLIEMLSRESKEVRIEELNTILKDIERWANAERNYNT